MTGLKIADNLSLPIDIITDTIGILAIRGSGKTYTFLALAEEMIRHNLPIIILDTMGVCWGIRSSADGKSPGLPVTILGGTHGDVPLESSAGKVIADWIVSERQPAILDISEFSKNEALHFTLDFTARLFQINHEPVHLMIDEADEWAPQRPFREEARTLRALEVLVRRGRARGIGVTLVTQRPATLNKNVLTQVGTLIVGRMIAPQDRKAVQAWIDAHGTEHQKEEFWGSLASISTKEKWIWAPLRNVFKRVLIRQRETFDSSKTPEIGKTVEPKSLAEVDLDALKEKIASTIERAKQEDPRELRKRIAELERRTPTPIRTETKIKEISILKEVQIKRLEKIVENLKKASDKLTIPIDEMAKQGSSITEAIKKYSMPKIEPKAIPPIIEKRIKKMMNQKDEESPPQTLRLGERRMLDVLCRWYPARLTKAQLATLSHLRVTSGTFSAYYGTLKRANLIDEGSNGIMVSELGYTLTGGKGVSLLPQTTDEVIQMWRSSLRAGERKLLDILVEVYPDTISKEELAERAELTASSGTFSAYLGTLRRNGLAEVRDGLIRAGEVLFMGEK